MFDHFRQWFPTTKYGARLDASVHTRPWKTDRQRKHYVMKDNINNINDSHHNISHNWNNITHFVNTYVFICVLKLCVCTLVYVDMERKEKHVACTNVFLYLRVGILYVCMCSGVGVCVDKEIY